MTFDFVASMRLHCDAVRGAHQHAARKSVAFLGPFPSTTRGSIEAAFRALLHWALVVMMRMPIRRILLARRPDRHVDDDLASVFEV